jgi:hypothetical protein
MAADRVALWWGGGDMQTVRAVKTSVRRNDEATTFNGEQSAKVTRHR